MASVRYRQINTEFLPQDLGRNLAMLRIEPEQISKRTGIQFRETYDDLDYLKLAVIRTSSNKKFGLTRHLHAPEKGVVIHSSRSQNTLIEDLREILSILGVRIHEVRWVNSDVRISLAQTVALAHDKGKLVRPYQRKFSQTNYGSRSIYSPLPQHRQHSRTMRVMQKASPDRTWDLTSVTKLVALH
jgi:hypothetical protein